MKTTDASAWNEAVFRSAEAVDQYSEYRLFPQEKVLFREYYEPGDSVLDLACGLGRTTVLLHEMGMRVRGIDISDVLINRASARFPYIPFEQGSYTAIAAGNESFQHVLISYNGLDYAHPQAQREQALAECYRVLRPGGTLIFSSHNLKSLYVSPYYLRRMGWKLRNTWRAFREWDYVMDVGLVTFYGAPDYIVRQTEACGFRHLASIGVRCSRHDLFNRFGSPHIHYAFEKVRTPAVTSPANAGNAGRRP